MGRAEDLRDRLLRDGENALDRLIDDRVAEELFLDFKRSSDRGASRGLTSTDRNTLAKAISGYANSEGGVIVWGVDCSSRPDGADVAKAKVPLADARAFVSWLEGAVSGCTVPPHGLVTHFAIERGTGPEGFVVTYVPKSDAAPHQVVGKNVYYIRAGSDFVRAPHGVLAGLFGRTPQPHVFVMFLEVPAKLEGTAIVGQVGILIRNNGPGIAQDLFVNVMVTDNPGPNSQIGLRVTDLGNWSGRSSFGFHMSLISNPGFRLPPEAQVQPVVLDYRVSPPFETGVDLSILVGSANSMPSRHSACRTKDGVQAIYDGFVTDWNDPLLREEAARSFASKLIDEGWAAG